MAIGSKLRLVWTKGAGAPEVPLSISGSPITSAQIGVNYGSWAAVGAGGTGPYTYSLYSGAYPTGLSIDPVSGVSTGTPSVSGNFNNIGVRVTDSASPTPATADLPLFNLSVAAAGELIVLFGNSVKNEAGSGLTAAATVQVNALANTVLIAAVFIGGGVSDNVTGVTATGYTGVATAMTRICGAKGSLGSRNHNCELWVLFNPPLGDNIITATRNGTNGTRFYVAGSVAYDVDQVAGVVNSTAVFANAPGSPNYSSNLTTTQNGLMVISAFSGQETGTATAAVMAGQTAIQDCEPSGQEYYGGLSYKNAPTAGGIAMGAGTGASNWRSCIVASLSLKPTTHVTVAPTFYAAKGGDDLLDGLTRGNAVATPARIQKFPKQSGKIIYVDGFVRPTAAPAAPTDYVFALSENGTLAEPVRVLPYDATPSAILGDVLYNTGWSAATLAETNSFFASIEKRAMGAALEWGMAATLDGMLLMPAQWSKAGYPTGIQFWDDAAPGSPAFYHYTPAEWGGSSDPSKMVSYSGTAGNYSVVIKDPDIGTHYLTQTPVGSALCYRGAGSNTAEVVEITGYNQAAGTITATGCDAFPAEDDGYWAVRFHPRDLVMLGQYAYTAARTDIFAAFPAAGDRGVIRYNFGLNLNGDYLHYNIGIGRCCATPGLSNQRVVNIVGDGNIMNGAIVAQFGICGSPDGININSTSDGAVHTNVRVLEGYDTSNAWRNFGSNWTVTGAYVRDVTGTFAYAGGNAINGIFTNSDFCEQFGIHGNVATSYSNSQSIQFTKLGLANCVSPITSQKTSAADKLIHEKSNTYTQIFVTGARSYAGTFDNAYAFRLDGGDYNSLIDRTYVANAPGGNILADNSAPNNASNSGMIVRRSVMPCLGVAAISCSGVLIQDIRTTATGGNTEAQWTSVGGATTPPARVTQTTVAFTGAPSDADWEIMSRNAGGAGGYSAFQLGPDTWDWQFPAYGAARTMVDLILTTSDVFSGYPQNKVIGGIVKARPGSTLSLPAGVTDNNSFGIDAGTIRYTAGTLSAAKTITVRETNAAATNGPTRDTVINITMRDPFATFG